MFNRTGKQIDYLVMDDRVLDIRLTRIIHLLILMLMASAATNVCALIWLVMGGE